ncbi:hypothetical protein [Ekhidna sp.]|uniref:dienelactone hydrolase family protein n=1 Tax=Ekhidna sp. TaxID=2608089 RepID=UPI003299459D
MRSTSFLNPLKGIVLLFNLIFFNPQPINAQTQSSEISFEDRKSLFSYDKSIDLGIKDIALEQRESVIIRDITFVGVPGTDSVEAYIVEPNGSGVFAGILWGHWLGHHTSNREQYLAEAVALASRGVISVLINTMWSDPAWYESRVLEEDYGNSIRQVIEFRRAMDLLMSHENVDTARIAFVGHDYSGMYGAIAAGVEPRAKTYVFIAVTSSLYDWAFLANQPKSKYEYVRQNAVFELTDFVSQLKGSVFCQFSNSDPFISKIDGNIFFNALTPNAKEKKRYDAGHFMKGEDIISDRTAWLIRELNLN